MWKYTHPLSLQTGIVDAKKYEEMVADVALLRLTWTQIEPELVAEKIVVVLPEDRKK